GRSQQAERQPVPNTLYPYAEGDTHEVGARQPDNPVGHKGNQCGYIYIPDATQNPKADHLCTVKKLEQARNNDQLGSNPDNDQILRKNPGELPVEYGKQ